MSISTVDPQLMDEYFGGTVTPPFLCASEARDLGVCEANSHRLVKVSKSPTSENNEDWKPASSIEWTPSRQITPSGAIGCKTVIEYRDWQECWRVRTETECISGSMPPDQSGIRESEILTARGATKIAEACEFMHLKKGGFKTFVTGTFDKITRMSIERGETSIQKEVTRTMDAMQKMYQRGWVKSDGTRVKGHADGMPYLWVVEIPENEDGEKNPHIHMLLGWRVDYCDFKEWANRIERIWGNGYFHLEKIKDSACAGAYMAKAAGYLTKAAGQDNQGLVEGNRYGISKTARAPSWVVVNYAQLQAMGQIIFDIYDHLSVKYGDMYRARKNLNEALSNTPKSSTGARKVIGERLIKVRKEINAIPIRCNKYQVVIKGKEAAYSFFTWLKTPTGVCGIDEEWLPEKPEGWHWEAGEKPSPKQSQFFSGLYKKLRQNRFFRRLNPPQWIKDHDRWEFFQSSIHDYEIFRDQERAGSSLYLDLDLCQ